MRMILLLCLASLAAAQAAADDTFTCHAIENLSGDAAAALYVSSDKKVATVDMAGEKFGAGYMVDGADRRWDFVIEGDGAYRMAITLGPSGYARLYDFKGMAVGQKIKPIMVMRCRKKAGPQ